MWVKPVLRCIFGTKIVYFGKPSEKSLNEGTAIAVKEGGYKFRWPDGHEEELMVTMVPYQERMNDMGYEYTMRGALPHLVLKYHGADIKTPLHETDVEIWKEY